MSAADLKMVNALNGCKSATPALLVNDSRGPKIPIYSIQFRDFDTGFTEGTRKVKELMSKISTAGGVYDKPEGKDSDEEEAFGGMRTIHANAQLHLPRHPVGWEGTLSGRGKTVHAYVV